MRDYHFDLGNSTDGPLGLCAVVRASSPEQALEMLRERLPETVEIATGSEYVHVYINTDHMRITDIDKDEDVRPDVLEHQKVNQREMKNLSDLDSSVVRRITQYLVSHTLQDTADRYRIPLYLVKEIARQAGR